MNSAIACITEVWKRSSSDSNNVFSLHCGFTADGESNLRSSNTGEWSDMTIAEYSEECTDGSRVLSIKK